jgi:hypothetical protein
MKNYSRIASKYGVIGSFMDTSNYIESYKINHQHQYVEIVHMSGWRHIETLDENTKKSLDQKQLEQLDEMREKINPKIDSRIHWQGSLLFLYGTNTLLQYSVGHWFAGTCWLLGAGIYFGQTYFPYKLKKEMTLVKWIMDNKKYVDQVIQEEVEEKMPKTTERNTMIPVKQEYPTDLVAYSERLYEEGINLSNIDELKIKQLKKLKKKATKVRGKSYV